MMMLARQEWIDACEFHNLTSAQVLQEVAERVKKHTHKKPVVLLDLDSTLYEVGPRTHHILRQWSQSAGAIEFPRVQKAMAGLKAEHVGYSLRDTFTAAGLDMNDAETQAAWNSAKKFWDVRFFTSAYLAHDVAYPGAADFVQKIYKLGAHLIYLTGRDEPGMGDGTRARLKQDGFPWEVERTHLLLKKAAHLDDLNHKKEAGKYVNEVGYLIASFENEPKNLSGLYEVFPESMHVFVDTVFSDHESLPRKGLYRIQGFET